MALTKQTASFVLHQIEVNAKQVYLECVGQEPDDVTCSVLNSTQIVIAIKRQLSSTESFLLRQNKLSIARDISRAVSQIVREALALRIKDLSDLRVANVSNLESTSIEELKWLVLLDS